MAYEALVGSDIGTLKAGADLSGKQYRFVKGDSTTNDQVVSAAAATDMLLGVLQNDPTSGQACQLRVIGVSKILLGGTVTRYDRLTSDSVGRAITAVGAQVVGAIALQSGVVGDIVSALVIIGADDFLALAAAGVAAGYKIARGQATTVTAADTIVTGLASVVAVVASMESDPVDDPFMCSAQVGNQASAPVAGSIILKTWKNTGGTDPTPLAATTFGKLVNWIAIGI